jgi:trans-2-enoyl-CoA reductase
MGEKFFYDWTKDDVWGVIDSTFESLWKQDKLKVDKEDKLKVDKKEVNEEFWNLKGIVHS